MDSVDSYQPLFAEDAGEPLTSPKQFKIVQIDRQRAVSLNKKWHSRFPLITTPQIGKYIYFGAVFNNKIYAVAIWTSPISANRLKDGFKLLELRRLAICDDAPKNTASFMISKMIKIIKKKFPDIIRLISYQDTEVHHGTIYKCSNWKIGAECKLTNWQNRRNCKKPQSTAIKIRWEYDL